MAKLTDTEKALQKARMSALMAELSSKGVDVPAAGARGATLLTAETRIEKWTTAIADSPIGMAQVKVFQATADGIKAAIARAKVQDTILATFRIAGFSTSIEPCNEEGSELVDGKDAPCVVQGIVSC
jgi:hypothetical protein